jgi:hypothetical protein
VDRPNKIRILFAQGKVYEKEFFIGGMFNDNTSRRDRHGRANIEAAGANTADGLEQF